MIRFALCALLGLLAHPVVAADTLGALLDIPLGASFARLERDLDFRDISASLAHMSGDKPDLGRRGYGCMRREDAQADIACVSHDEKIDGVALREVRLHFLHGRLYQFSMSAEVQFYDVVVAHLRARNGAPLAAPAGEVLRWQDEAAQIAAYRGKDLIFVNFQMASYADAVKRKREGAVFECY